MSDVCKWMADEVCVNADYPYCAPSTEHPRCCVHFEKNRRKERQMKVMLDPGAYKPERAHYQDAGMDFRCIKGGWLWPFGSRTFDTGVHMALPEGSYGKIESKSGLNVKASIVSCGGTIDEGYTGAICVKLYNFGLRPYRFRDGDKIAQLIIMECLKPPIEIVDALEDTARGTGGFGSTGR